jgi:hypothetical protein
VSDLWSDLLACLDLHPVPSEDTGEVSVGDDVTEFEGDALCLRRRPGIRSTLDLPQVVTGLT